MNNKNRVAEYILEHPNATNEEIATTLNINKNSVKVYISRLKSEGYIKIVGTGDERDIQTIADYEKKDISSATIEKMELKKDVYTKLLTRYLEDFELTDDVDKHLKLGNSILRILENI